MKINDEQIKTIIQSTVKHLIQHEKKELLELMHEWRKGVGEDFPDSVLELEELVDVYLLEESFEKELIMTKIEERRKKLEEKWNVQLLFPNLSNVD